MLDWNVVGRRRSPLWAPRSWTRAPLVPPPSRADAGARGAAAPAWARVHERGAHGGLLRAPHLIPLKHTWTMYPKRVVVLNGQSKEILNVSREPESLDVFGQDEVEHRLDDRLDLVRVGRAGFVTVELRSVTVDASAILSADKVHRQLIVAAAGVVL